jgi:hypothetical protein
MFHATCPHGASHDLQIFVHCVIVIAIVVVIIGSPNHAKEIELDDEAAH